MLDGLPCNVTDSVMRLVTSAASFLLTTVDCLPSVCSGKRGVFSHIGDRSGGKRRYVLMSTVEHGSALAAGERKPLVAWSNGPRR